MPTKTDIANQALARVGVKNAIMSLDDEDSVPAQIARLFFDDTVKEVGRSADWQCLKDRATLGQLAAAPAFGWDHQYQLPSDFLRLIKLNGVEYRGQPSEDHELEGRVLLTDADEANIEYVAYKEDTDDYDSLFIQALVVLLAAKMAVPLRQDEALATRLMGEYTSFTLPRARVKSNAEKRAKRFDPTAESNFTNSRFNSTNG